MAQMVPRTSYDHIVLLTDLTNRSDSALSYARAFAQYYGSKLTLVHALEKHGLLAPGSREIKEADAEKARVALEAVADGLRVRNIEVHTHLQETLSLKEDILSCLERLHPDLIIQGTATIDDVRRVVVGSVAESIFRSTRIPVLTVAAQVLPFMDKGLHFDRILFVTNFGSQTTNSAIYALSLAQEFRACIILCHVYDGRNAAWDKVAIQEYFDRALERQIAPQVKDWCDPKRLVAFGDVETEIRLVLSQQRPDLVITAAHSLGPLGTRGKPGTVFKIIANAECPVLTMLGAPEEARQTTYPHNCSDAQFIG